jgi:transcription elongation GreA/GreB family factor
VTFSRPDGRVQTYASSARTNPIQGRLVSFVSPVAKSLIGKAVGDVVSAGNQELTIVAMV